MATIYKQVLVDTNKRALVKWVYLQTDGTQQANSVLLDASTLSYALNTSGKIMQSGVDRKSNYRTSIKRIFGSIHTKNKGTAAIQWQGDSNSYIAIASDSVIDYNFEAMGDGAVITNPETNPTGNILCTTAGLQAGDAFTLFLDLRKDSRDYDAGQTADPYAFNTAGIK